jgi:hypothetical protein
LEVVQCPLLSIKYYNSDKNKKATGKQRQL